MERDSSDRAHIELRGGGHGPIVGDGSIRPEQEDLSEDGLIAPLLRFDGQKQASLHLLTARYESLINDKFVYLPFVFNI